MRDSVDEDCQYKLCSLAGGSMTKSRAGFATGKHQNDIKRNKTEVSTFR